MVTSETAILKILPGNVYIEDQAIIFEVDGSLQKTALPFESLEVVELLLEKERSIADLVSEIKKRNGGQISFKSLFFTTQKLINEGIVYSASAPTPFIDSPRIKILNELTVDLILAPKQTLPQLVRRPFFFALSLAIIVGGCHGFMEFWNEPAFDQFLFVNGRYDAGFVFALLLYSGLVSAKTLILYVLNLTGFGRVYDLAVRISPLSFALRVDDNYLYSSARKSVALFYGLASLSCFFFLADIGKLYFFSSWVTPHIFTAALLLTLFDLNPIGKGELKRIVKAFVSEEGYDHLRPFYETRVLRSGLKFFKLGRQDFGFLVYSKIVIGWCLVSLTSMLYLAYVNGPTLSVALGSDDMAQRASAGIVACLLFVPFIYICTDLVNSIFTNFTGLNYGVISHFKNRFGSKVLKYLDRNRLKEYIRATPIFSAVEDNLIEFIIDNGLVVSYKGGTPIIQQNTSGSEIYLILTGSVLVQRREDSGLIRKLANLQAGSIFGEMSVYGMEERTADVIANERVQAFVIRAEALLELSRSADYQVQMQYVMDRIMITQYFMSQPFFSSLPVELIQVFYNNGIVEEHESNKVVIQQGTTGEDFYLILRGSAFVEIGGQTVNTLNQGEFFGEIALLHDNLRTASVRTAVKSTVLRVPSHIFWQLALSNLEVAAYFESIAEKRLEEIRTPLAQAMKEAANQAAERSETEKKTDEPGEPAA